MRAILIGLVLAGALAGAGGIAESAPRNAGSGIAKTRSVAVSIRNGAVLEVVRRRWDAALLHWMFLIRCVRPGDCIPFWLSAADLDSNLEIRRSIRNLGSRDAPQASDRGSKKKEPAAGKDVVVRRGEKAKVLWQLEGIRAELSAICLEDGPLGAAVRVRIPGSGRVLRAVVIGKGTVQSDENAR